MKTSRPHPLLAAAFVLVVAGVWAVHSEGTTTSTGADTPSSASVVRQATPFPGAPNYRQIVADNKPAVVGITTESDLKVDTPSERFYGEPFGWFGGNDPFFRFFRNLPIPRSDLHTRALGSGFIISSDGLILTNAHVVRDAKRVTVKLYDRRELRAKVLGSDPVTDIAVLKIDAHNLPTVRLGNSDQLQVGDYVLAIGQPYGFEESATAGIVSAKGRSLPGDSAVPFIQTDVAVNPGNSGGPLFDSSGAVVGINAQIYSTTGGYQGLSFAIPINVAVNAKNQIVRTGVVEHAQLGVEVQSLTPALASSFNRSPASGALVARVTPYSAAANAGLKPGDIILSYNQQPVSDAGDLSAKVGSATPGDTIALQVWRDGHSMDLRVHLRPAESTAEDTLAGSSAEPHEPLGLDVRPLTPEEREQSGVSGGLLVRDASGRAADAGVEAGDIVLAVDGTSVNSAGQLRALVRDHKAVALLVQRGDQRLFLPLQLG